MADVNAKALADAMASTLKEIKIKRLIETLFIVKVKEVVDAVADTLVEVLPQTVAKHLSKWKPRHKSRL